MAVNVTLDKAAVKARVEAASKKATFVVANELLKDANYYCREDTGALIDSSLRASKLEEGLLIWDTPYAKRVYYTGTPSDKPNSEASLMWAKKAADEHRAEYLSMAQQIINKEV